MTQQGRFIEYGGGSGSPVKYGADTVAQADQAWGQIAIAAAGDLGAQSGRGVFSEAADQLVFTFPAPQADVGYYVDAHMSGVSALIIGVITKAVGAVTLVIYDPATGLEVALSGLAAAIDVQIHIYRLA